MIWLPIHTILKKTLECTTQLAKNYLQLPLQRHIKSREPALNLPCLAEEYATDTFFAETAAIGSATCAQIYVGTKSYYTNVFGMKRESKAPCTLDDFVRKTGAPQSLHNDNTQVEKSTEWHDHLWQHIISKSYTEPHHPQQNPAERRIQFVKGCTMRLLDQVGAPPQFWLLAFTYVVLLLNVVSHEQLRWKTPTEAAFGTMPDISVFLQHTAIL